MISLPRHSRPTIQSRLAVKMAGRTTGVRGRVLFWFGPIPANGSGRASIAGPPAEPSPPPESPLEGVPPTASSAGLAEAGEAAGSPGEPESADPPEELAVACPLPVPAPELLGLPPGEALSCVRMLLLAGAAVAWAPAVPSADELGGVPPLLLEEPGMLPVDGLDGLAKDVELPDDPKPVTPPDPLRPAAPLPVGPTFGMLLPAPEAETAWLVSFPSCEPEPPPVDVPKPSPAVPGVAAPEPPLPGSPVRADPAPAPPPALAAWLPLATQPMPGRALPFTDMLVPGCPPPEPPPACAPIGAPSTAKDLLSPAS